jgi:hypothetical protein
MHGGVCVRAYLVVCVVWILASQALAEEKAKPKETPVFDLSQLDGCRAAHKDVGVKLLWVENMLESAADTGDALLLNCISEVHLAMKGLFELSKAALLQTEAVHQQQHVLDPKAGERLRLVHSRVMAWLRTAQNCRGAKTESGDVDLSAKYFGASQDLKESTGDELYIYDESGLLLGPYAIPMEATTVEVGADRAPTGLEPGVGVVEESPVPPRPVDASPYMDILMDTLLQQR